MGSYELIKEDPRNEGIGDVKANGGRDRYDDASDVELALRKSQSPSLCATDGRARNKGKAVPAANARLVSLDVFRGLTVSLMILVDDAGGIVPAINHSPWNGLTLADFVMPFFLFIVGLSLGLANKNFSCRVGATKKAISRAVKLLILGLFLQGGYFHGLRTLTYGVDIKHIRWMGTLQRIAIAYMVSAVCEIWLKGDDGKCDIGHMEEDEHLNPHIGEKRHVVLMEGNFIEFIDGKAVALALTAIYLSLLYGLYVPDWNYQVKCGLRGDTGPSCNAVGMIDRKILGIQHLYKRPIYSRTKQCSINSPDYGPLPPDAPSWCRAPFDPEGLLSSVMAIVTCLIGLHYGHIIVHLKDHRSRLSQWMIASFGLVLFGVVFDFSGMHINKALYTVSYVCVTAGAAGILFAGIYVLVDMYGYKRSIVVLEWMGMNALLIYILIACNILPVILQGFYWGRPQNNIVSISI
ncbi:hypothetical protein RJ640_000118 [Escallonia rubra]|uniref:Heparan-alpha-glucosaminide N-acetyltransferase catalytic domain-containing protein n=1 Tax=Escallonia rubra TaxID=112253 RepID=A0AA88R2R9_9ASTE|nr:hypothetical protein RJ640_000118 [Escallonia rubra]